MVSAGRLCPLSHEIFQQPCEAGRTGIIPNEGNLGQGKFNGPVDHSTQKTMEGLTLKGCYLFLWVKTGSLGM